MEGYLKLKEEITLLLIHQSRTAKETGRKRRKSEIDILEIQHGVLMIPGTTAII